jgi:hypothetical protein
MMNINLSLDSWVDSNFGALFEGQRLFWPSYFPHPVYYGFRKIVWAEGVEGKIGDWALSIEGCMRLHAWEFPNNQFIVHLDKYDPDQGKMVEHLAHESKVFQNIVLGGVALAAIYGISRELG